MADESPVNIPVTQAQSARNWKPLGFGLICLSNLLDPILSASFSFTLGWSKELFLASWLVGVLGTGIYARSGWSWGWMYVAVIPLLGPPMVLIAIAVDSLLAKLAVSNFVRRLAGSAVVMGGIGLVAYIAISIFLHFNVKARQAEARTYLGSIWLAEKTFYDAHKRYGTFDEIGFNPPQPTRYTYRIDQSGKPGTVILSTTGQPVTPDNTVVSAGFSATGFTATATANLDSDPAIDQWHVNDMKQSLSKADVNDVQN